MRAQLLHTLNALNECGLRLVDTYARTLTDVPAFTQQTTTRQPLCALVSSRPSAPEPPDLQQTREPYFLMNPRMDNICVSASLQQLLEVPAEALYGDKWTNVVDGADELRLLNNKWLIAAQTHEGFTHTVRCVTGTGAVVFIFMRVAPYRHPVTHAFEGFFGVCRAAGFPMTLITSHAQSA